MRDHGVQDKGVPALCALFHFLALRITIMSALYACYKIRNHLINKLEDSILLMQKISLSLTAMGVWWPGLLLAKNPTDKNLTALF